MPAGARLFGSTDIARDAWGTIYHDLSADRPGMAGALLARAEAHVMRLSAIYCVLDGQNAIELDHLKAALALWQYAESSTRLIFGDSLGRSCRRYHSEGTPVRRWALGLRGI